MDERYEREWFQNQCMRLSKQLAVVHMVPLPSKLSKAPLKNGLTIEDKIFYMRRAFQISQALVFNRFIELVLEKILLLSKKPEAVEDIARDSLELLHIFMEEYIDLVEQEYQWCK